ncbi:MAG: hypothetical protein V2B19_10875 [Pseudomonadota bacterium]
MAENTSYLPFGPLKGFLYGNGQPLTKTFDEIYRLSGQAAGGLKDYAYAYDGAGNITAITDKLNAAKNQSFSYDIAYRLTSASGIYGTAGYTYDKAGNRLSQTLGAKISSYGYEPGTNRVSAVTGASPQSFSYDAHGNTTRRGNKTLTYNQDHRLIEVKEDAASDAHYVYDGNGRRIKKAAGGVTTIFHYDQSGNLIGESTPGGVFTRVYYYLGGMRLALAEKEPGDELEVKVSTSLGRFLPGVKVYAFTQSGTNTGKTATTDETGTAVFEAADFSTGTYKFRADYLGVDFLFILPFLSRSFLPAICTNSI